MVRTGDVANLLIGKVRPGNNVEIFKGLMDEVRIYNRAYGPDELYVVNSA